MPGKSRHRKGKHPVQRKKRKGRQRFATTVIQQPAVTETHKPVAPSVSVPIQMPALTTVRSPYILTELRRIGILAGTILAILVVLALVLS